MTWLRDAFEFLDGKLGKQGVEIVISQCEPEGHYLLVNNNDGSVTHVEAKRKRSKFTFAGTKAFCDWIITRTDDEPAIFVCGNYATYYSDLYDGRSVVAELPLCYSPIFLDLQDRYYFRSRSQEDFIGKIFDLKPYLSTDSTLYNFARNLKWSKTETNQGEVGASKSTFGSEIEREVKSEAKLPDKVELVSVPVYDGHGFYSNIMCRLQVNLSDQTLSLVLNQGEIAKAQSGAVDFVVAAIEDKLLSTVPIYRGEV